MPSPQFHPAASIKNVKNGADTINQIVTVGLTSTEIIKQQ